MLNIVSQKCLPTAAAWRGVARRGVARRGVARRGAAAAKPTNLTDSSEIWNIVRNSRVVCKSEILDQSVNIEPFYGPGNIAFSCFDNHF